MGSQGSIYWKMINKLRTKIKQNKLLISLFLIGLLLRLFFSVQIYSGDVNNHIGWAKDALSSGFTGIYGRSFEKYGVMTPTYPPIPLFFFTFFYWLFTVVYSVALKLNLGIKIFPSGLIWFLEDQDIMPAFLKIPAILADLGIAYLVFLFFTKILGKNSKKWPIIGFSLVLFNPAFFYNSAFWGQIESVPLFFILTSFYCLFFKESWRSVIILTLAILTKQTVIIFLPLFAFIYYQKYGFKRSLRGVFLFLLIFCLFFLPFCQKEGWLTFPFLTYWNKIQTGSGSNYVTDHAFNFWALTTGLGKISDGKPFWLGLSYSIWGNLLFGSILIIIFTRLLIRRKVKTRDYLFAAALIPFAAFLFLTRMHERYLETALPFLLLLNGKKRFYLFSFLFISFFYLVNLYHNWWFPNSLILKNILSNLVVIRGLIILLISVFGLLLVKYYQGEPKDEAN